jgi:hypothetical protein
MAQSPQIHETHPGAGDRAQEIAATVVAAGNVPGLSLRSPALWVCCMRALWAPLTSPAVDVPHRLISIPGSP